MLLQVHDEVVFEVDADAADELAPKLAEVMQSVVEISVPLVVEVGKGNNWDEAHSSRCALSFQHLHSPRRR